MTNKEAIKRRYTFGNDEFSLEAAYHDCKLVFDGITDDDSFQEADTGLILYYANEIIYALHEALEGKDIDVPSIDTISRQAAIDAVNSRKTAEQCKEGEVRNWTVDACIDMIKQLPPIQPKRGKWIDKGVYTYVDDHRHLFKCDQCGNGWLDTPDFCPNCGAKMEVTT